MSSRPTALRRAGGSLFALSLAVGAFAPVGAQEGKEPREARPIPPQRERPNGPHQFLPPEATQDFRTKATLLRHFLRFVEWPQDRLPKSDSPILIGVFGAQVFSEIITASFGDRPIDGHPVRVVQIRAPRDAKDCHVVFFTGTGPAGPQRAPDFPKGAELGPRPHPEFRRLGLQRGLELVRDTPVLTIGEAGDFVPLGGMVSFVRDGNRLRLEVCEETAKRSGITISSKVLRIATLTPSERGKPRDGARPKDPEK